jgi:hypothetical protein
MQAAASPIADFYLRTLLASLMIFLNALWADSKEAVIFELAGVTAYLHVHIEFKHFLCKGPAEQI